MGSPAGTSGKLVVTQPIILHYRCLDVSSATFIHAIAHTVIIILYTRTITHRYIIIMIQHWLDRRGLSNAAAPSSLPPLTVCVCDTICNIIIIIINTSRGCNFQFEWNDNNDDDDDPNTVVYVSSCLHII